MFDWNIKKQTGFLPSFIELNFADQINRKQSHSMIFLRITVNNTTHMKEN